MIGIATIKAAARDDRTLRAITLSYIDRALQTSIAPSLVSLLSGDFTAQANDTKKSVSSKTIKIIADGLLGKK